MENKTVFVLLAGGKSQRMGFDKGLLTINANYWILEQLNTISKTTISEIIIGLGYNYQNYFKAIPWLEKATSKPVKFKHLKIAVVINRTPELGSFSTLQTVLKTIDTTVDILVHPIDIPLLNNNELQQLININNWIVQPSFNLKNGHPIKLSSKIWSSFSSLNSSEETARLDVQLKKINPINISTIEVNDRAILMNLNTPNDWSAYLEYLKK